MINKIDWIGLKREPTHAEVLLLEYYNLNLTTWTEEEISTAIILLKTVYEQRNQN